MAAELAPSRWGWLLPVTTLAVLAALPAVLTPYTQDLVLKIGVSSFSVQ